MPDEGLEGPIVIIKFRRQDIEDALKERGEILDTEFVLTGTFDDGTALYGQLYSFEGRDTVTKIIQEEPPSGSSGNGGKKKSPPYMRCGVSQKRKTRIRSKATRLAINNVWNL